MASLHGMLQTAGRPKLLLLTVTLLALVGLTLLAVFAWPSDTLDASSVLAKSQDAKAQIAAQAREGQLLHYKTKEYLRQGPIAPLVQEMQKDDFYTPESASREMWFLVGPSGKIVRMYGLMTDDAGNVVQKVTTEGSEVVSRSLLSDAEEHNALPDRSVQDMARDLGAQAERYEEAASSGAAKVVGHGDVGGKRTTILELDRKPAPKAAEESVAAGTDESYSLPYIDDLGAVEQIERIEVDAGTFLTYRWWMVAVDAAGEEQLISEVATVAYDVLEASAVPAEALAP